MEITWKWEYRTFKIVLNNTNGVIANLCINDCRKMNWIVYDNIWSKFPRPTLTCTIGRSDRLIDGGTTHVDGVFDILRVGSVSDKYSVPLEPAWLGI